MCLSHNTRRSRDRCQCSLIRLTPVVTCSRKINNTIINHTVNCLCHHTIVKKRFCYVSYIIDNNITSCITQFIDSIFKVCYPSKTSPECQFSPRGYIMSYLHHSPALIRCGSKRIVCNKIHRSGIMRITWSRQISP